jgi:Amylo-alpha-1,6-glucosidase
MQLQGTRQGRAPMVAIAAVLLLVACQSTPQQPATPRTAQLVALDSLGIPVSAEENRAVSFTNKRSAFFYMQTHRNDHAEHAFFRGFNIAGRRIFSDYQLFVAGKALDPQAATVLVRPDALIRTHPQGITETLRLFDGQGVVEVEVRGARGDVTLQLSGDTVAHVRSGQGIDEYTATQAGDAGAVDHIVVGRRDDLRLTQALRWLQLTTDSLVTRQRGDGIYAGLPWFNEYWGRDSFISLPGATLVTGRFEEARAILTSFAEFQDLDRAIVAELYPNVQASIEGALENFTDASGYLVHADNETWMDARREPDKVSYSPRSTRANDVQALWYEQLRAGADFAAALGDEESATRWSVAADRLRNRFAHDFVDPATGRMADHLDARDAPNLQLRPNLLFSLQLLDQPEDAARSARQAWEALVYPWGVATLDQGDPGFHPYHVAPEHYHKDAAYHNGAVWPWLNGIAMQRMIELGQSDLAWQLFANMNEIALTRGVVGGLPENLDAYPHPGESAPRLTGTFLQGWSNAEQLRVWYQGFLGIQPDLEHGVIRLAPRLPEAFGDVEFNLRIGAGVLHASYERSDRGRRYTWRLQGQSARLDLDIVPFERHSVTAAAGDTVIVEQTTDSLIVRHIGIDGSEREPVTVTPAPLRREQQARFDAILAGTEFAKPGSAAAHPALRQSRTP